MNKVKSIDYEMVIVMVRNNSDSYGKDESLVQGFEV